MSAPVYLDYAAATPMSEDVYRAMTPFFTDEFYNPSGLSLSSKAVQRTLEEARQNVANCLGARPQEIVFTAGGTESDNLAINGVMQAFEGKNLVVSAIEHPAVLEPAEQYKHKIVDVDKHGRVNLDALAEAIDEDTVLVSIMLVNNEIGTIQPLSEISALVKSVALERQEAGNQLPLYLHTDACQAAEYLDLHVSSLGVDLMTLNGGKMYGPKQSGILYKKTDVKLRPQILGGGQEFGIRSGTQNVAACVGLALALQHAQEHRKAEAARVAELQQYFIDSLSELPSTSINGSLKHRVANNVHVTFEGIDNEWLLMSLDERGIVCGIGSACSASTEEPSHVLKAIGLGDDEARSSLRFSLGRATVQKDIDKTMKELRRLFGVK